MIPAYRSMDSYPYQTNQMPFPHCYYPGIEAIPSHIKVDPSKSPYAGSYGCLIPVHFCCGHTNFPGYYSYRPAYPHPPAPSPMYYYGGCPSYGEPFCFPYSPQPHYTMELPRYGYDKCMPRDCHCCRCPNHPYCQKEGRSVKIEQQEPDVGNKVNDALVPTQLENYPYPFVWIPPEYTRNRELKNPVTSEVGEQDKISQDRKPPGPGYFRADGQEPKVWNGWLPFDVNSAPHMIHDGDGRRNQNWQTDFNMRESEDGRVNQKHQSDDKRMEFPFPIIWMPYYNNQEESGRKNNQESTSTLKSIEEVPHTFKSVPVNYYAAEVVTNETRSNQDESTNTSGSDVTEKVADEKSVPVKQMELHQGKNDSEGSDRRERNIPVKQMAENMTKKDSHASVERQSTSPGKTSKLPPVCLRVDPLPRKKNGEGSSRSPSPHASKENSQATAGETSKTPSLGMNDKAQPDSNLQNASNLREKGKPKERTVQASENKTSENNSADSRDGSQSQINFNMPIGVSTGPKESRTNGDEYRFEENKAENMMEQKVTESREVRNSSKPTDDECRKERKVLSDVDAAVLIQATYRGFQVRKWEPLKKLKQIAEVSKEVTDVSGRIQTLEASSDLQNDDKQRVILGENIMRLLLKLDTIQGLHSSFREIRKSLARELISLQEKLDSIMAKKPQQQMQELFAGKLEDTPPNTQNEEYVEEQQKEKVAASGEDSSEDTSPGSDDMLEKCQDQFCTKDGIISLPADDGGRQSQLPVDSTSNEVTEPIVLPNGIVNEDVSRVVTVDACNSPSGSETDKMEVDNLDITWKELPVGVIDEDLLDINSGKDEQTVIEGAEAQLTEFTTTLEDRNFLAMVDDSARDSVDSEIHAMVELPVGLLDENKAKSEFEKRDEIAEGVLQAGDAECIAELPVGLRDEDTATSEFEKHDETKISNEVLPAGEGECNYANVKASSSTDDTTKETQLEQQLLEEQEEVQSAGESDGWVKIEFQKEDEFKGDVLLDIGVEYQSGEEIGNDAKQPSTTTEANGREVASGDVCLEVNDVKNIQPEPMESVINTQAHRHINDMQKEEEPEEKAGLQETQFEGRDIVAEQVISADAKETETLTKEKNELYAASPAYKELPVSERDGGLYGDTKLLEENRKLRKMMKKLLEAGNEHLTVISDLTGRVKDLEKKLARSKRVRTKRQRPATSKCFARPNNPLQGKTIDVVM